MKFPWKSAKMETRADSSYTDAFLSALLARSTGQSTAFPAAVGALEAASGLTARAFATAMVQTGSMAVSRALTPSCLAMIGRALVRKGEIVFYIDTSAGMIDLLPCQSHDVDGGPNPRTWIYRCTTAGPERTYTFDHMPADSVVHLMHSRDPEQPFRGIGPLQSAQLTGRLASETLAALADESSGPRGHIMGLPVDGDDPTLAPLKAAIGKLKGEVAYLEDGDYGGAAGGGKVMLKPERLGPEPTAALVELLKISREDVFGACGINPALFETAPGVAMREAYREFLFSNVAALGKMVAAELTAKLGDTVTLDWEELRAGDIASHARAFGTLVQGGMDLERAAALSGLLAAE